MVYRQKRFKRQRTIKVFSYQTGKRKSVKADNRIKALPPSKRISKTGKRYTETRKNRSDKRGKNL